MWVVRSVMALIILFGIILIMMLVWSGVVTVPITLLVTEVKSVLAMTLKTVRWYRCVSIMTLIWILLMIMTMTVLLLTNGG